MTYKKIAVFGATSGIGRALAERYIENGSFVIAIGRRKENLDATVKKYGADKVEATQFDITKLDAIDGFVSDLMNKHPDLDCAFMNSGIQRSFDFSQPGKVDMGVLNEELITNYLSQVQLTKAFIPFFQSKTSESALMYTTSALALVPMLRVPNYCATKAAMHHFILVLREQLRSSNIRVVEIFPPLVQTELHDAKHQPEMKDVDLSAVAMPLDEFTDKAWEQLSQGKDQIPVGMAEVTFQKFENSRQEMFRMFVDRSKAK